MPVDGIAVPQPAPKPGGVSVVDDLVLVLRRHQEQLGERAVAELVTFLEERRAFGRRKYGQELLTEDGRSSHLDALQEAVDLVQYLHKLELERARLAAEVQQLRAKLVEVDVARACCRAGGCGG